MLKALLMAVLVMAAGAAPAQTALDRGRVVAFLGIVFIDTSTEGSYFGENTAETARVALLEDMVRARFIEEGFTLADLAPVAGDLERVTNPADCYGCDLRLAAKLDAGYVLVGEVQKVSNLILAMNLVLREAPEGRRVRGLAVDIRSNTDDSWRRGMRYILENNFFRS